MSPPHLLLLILQMIIAWHFRLLLEILFQPKKGKGKAKVPVWNRASPFRPNLCLLLLGSGGCPDFFNRFFVAIRRININTVL